MVYTYKHNYGLFGVESSFNSVASTTKDIGLIQNVTPGAKNNTEVIRAVGSRLPMEVIAGMFEGNIDIEYLFQHGKIFELLTGNTDTSVNTGSDYTHTNVDVAGGKPVSENVSSFSYEDGYNSTTDIVNKYTGCIIGSMTIGVDVKGKISVKISAPYAGAEPVGSSASAAVLSTLPVFPSFLCTLSRGTEGAESAVAAVQSMEITFNNTTTPVPQLGSRNKYDEQVEDFDIRYRFTLAFQDSTQQQIFMGGTSPSAGTPDATGLVFNANNGVTLGSGRRELNIELRGCVDEDESRPVSIGGIVVQEISGYAKTLYKLETVDNINSY